MIPKIYFEIYLNKKDILKAQFKSNQITSNLRLNYIIILSIAFNIFKIKLFSKLEPVKARKYIWCFIASEN